MEPDVIIDNVSYLLDFLENNMAIIQSDVNRVAQINLLGGNRNAQLRGLLNFD